MQPVDAETQKAMMSFYHKKQEEQKVQSTIARADQNLLASAQWHNSVTVRDIAIMYMNCCLLLKHQHILFCCLSVCPLVCLSHMSCWSLQKLAENDEDDYTNSVWANPKALKHHFSGVGSVRIR